MVKKRKKESSTEENSRKTGNKVGYNIGAEN